MNINPKKNEIENLPVKYVVQKKGWMDRVLFMNWFQDAFIPEVIAKHPDLPG